MSGKYWLERDPKDSPGLQRIQEAQQAAALARKSREEIKRQTAELNDVKTQKLEKDLVEAERKMRLIFPVLEEIARHANTTHSYPLGSDLEKTEGYQLMHENIHIIRPAGVHYDKGQGKLEMRYGFRALYQDLSDWGDSFPTSSPYPPEEAIMFYGIKLCESDGEVKLCRHTEATAIRRPYSTRPLSLPEKLEAVRVLNEEWITVPTDKTQTNQLLAEAFHNPIYLGGTKAREEQEDNTDIVRLIKGFLGF